MPTSRPCPVCESDPDFALLDGTLAECYRVGGSRADYSARAFFAAGLLAAGKRRR